MNSQFAHEQTLIAKKRMYPQKDTKRRQGIDYFTYDA